MKVLFAAYTPSPIKVRFQSAAPSFDSETFQTIESKFRNFGTLPPTEQTAIKAIYGYLFRFRLWNPVEKGKLEAFQTWLSELNPGLYTTIGTSAQQNLSQSYGKNEVLEKIQAFINMTAQEVAYANPTAETFLKALQELNILEAIQQ